MTYESEWLFPSNFWPLLNHATFSEATGTVTKIDLGLKPYPLLACLTKTCEMSVEHSNNLLKYIIKDFVCFISKSYYLFFEIKEFLRDKI